MKLLFIILLLIIFLFIGVRIIFFIISPLVKKSNFVKVYNNFFFIREKKSCIEIHLGFARDFIFFDGYSSRKILLYLASGLLELIKEIESGKIKSNKVIQGNPYFFKPSNFQRFGFYARNLSILEKIRFYLNYFELSFLNSLARKKIVLVKSDKVKIVYTNALTLLSNKEKILSFYHKLQKDNELSKFHTNSEIQFASKTAV